MTERKNYRSITIETSIADIITKEAWREDKTISEKIADYRNKSIAFEEQINELREQMRSMIKAEVN